MKVDFFNGAMRFEGNLAQFQQLMKMLPDIAPNMHLFQNSINDAIFRHQKKMTQLQLEFNKNNSNQGPPPNFNPGGMLQ